MNIGFEKEDREIWVGFGIEVMERECMRDGAAGMIYVMNTIELMM